MSLYPVVQDGMKRQHISRPAAADLVDFAITIHLQYSNSLVIMTAVIVTCRWISPNGSLLLASMAMTPEAWSHGLCVVVMEGNGASIWTCPLSGFSSSNIGILFLTSTSS